jgi:cytochrome c oxidase assembly factor CtaG/putative copper export protein
VTSTAAPEAPEATAGQSPRWGPRLVWAGAALVVLFAAAVALGVLWRPLAEGLPDAGRVVVNGLPVLRLVGLLAGGAVLGFTLSAVALDPGAAGPSAGLLTRGGRRDLALASAAAWLLAVVSLLFALFTLADVLGLSLRSTMSPAILTTYLWDVEVSRAHLISAVLAMTVAFGLVAVRTLGAAAVWFAVAAVAVGIPSLTGHASGLGGHSLALIGGFLHAVSTAVWGGGVVALATHAVQRDPDMRERVRRFGVVAIISVVTIALTGVAAAATRLDSVGQLVTTAYGRAVLAKVLALVAAGGLGLLARRAWRGAGAQVGPGRMLAEVGALGGTLGLAVVLARSPFPRETLQFDSVGEEIIGYAYPPAPTVASVALGWHPDWVWLTAGLLAIALYTTGFVLLRARGDRWPVGRLVSWVLGWLVVIWATCAGVAWYAPVSFTLHMISHMVLAMLAPVLLVMGGPITLALRVVPAAPNGARGPREWITWALHSPVTRFVTHPAYALFIYTVGLYGLYYTSLYEWLMSTHLGHFGMQVHFLAAGYLFYWVVIGVDAGPRRLGYPARLILLMASLVIHSFFAVPMMMTEVPMVAGWYDLVDPEWLVDPVADTRMAGAIAWGFGELPTLVVAIALGVQWARSDEREARRADRRADRDGDAELRAYNERLARMNAGAQARGGADPAGGPESRDHPRDGAGEPRSSPPD